MHCSVTNWRRLLHGELGCMSNQLHFTGKKHKILQLTSITPTFSNYEWRWQWCRGEPWEWLGVHTTLVKRALCRLAIQCYAMLCRLAIHCYADSPYDAMQCYADSPYNAMLCRFAPQCYALLCYAGRRNQGDRGRLRGWAKWIARLSGLWVHGYSSPLDTCPCFSLAQAGIAPFWVMRWALAGGHYQAGADSWVGHSAEMVHTWPRSLRLGAFCELLEILSSTLITLYGADARWPVRRCYMFTSYVCADQPTKQQLSMPI